MARREAEGRASGRGWTKRVGGDMGVMDADGKLRLAKGGQGGMYATK